MLDILRDETPRLGADLLFAHFSDHHRPGHFWHCPLVRLQLSHHVVGVELFFQRGGGFHLHVLQPWHRLVQRFGGCLAGCGLPAIPRSWATSHGAKCSLCIDPSVWVDFFGLGQGVHGNMTDSPQHVMLVYCFTFFITGTLIASTMMNNNKMFSDVVPRENYTYVYALDRAIEGTFGAFGQPIVGWLADHIFHFDPSRANTLSCSPEDASSLAQGIYSVCAIGCVICFLFYSLAHYTYPRDRQRALQATTAKSQASKSAESSDEQSL